MHQSVLVEGSSGSLHLVIIGGKYSLPNWTSMVETLDVTLIVKPRAEKDAEKRKVLLNSMEWKTMKTMAQPRANFAATVIDGLVYVFGGISSKHSGHFPKIASPLIEVFNLEKNVWSDLNINNAPQLACFGWTMLNQQ